MSFRRFVKLFIPTGLFKKIEPTGHLLEGILFNLLYRFPGRKLKVIGVTGTNGKTTTSFLVHCMLHEAGLKVGLMTTVAYGVGDNIYPQTYHMTNVTMPALMKRLTQLKKEGAEWVVLEATSQGLAQNRLWGVPFHLAVMTNVTHEHLDWHGSFENYRDAKRLLFKRTNRNKRGLRTGIINAEDPSAQLFAQDVEKAVTYGVEKGDLRATKVKMTPSGNSYQVRVNKQNLAINTKLPGSFNVYNSLAAAGVGHVLGLSKSEIEKGIAALETVEGRMTTINEGQDFEVIVDYAHTPDSFEKLFSDLKPLVKGRLIALFGSAGRRDEAKRAVQGKIAGKYADEIVITEEDDRDIDGQQIMNEIAEGAEFAGKTRGKDLFLVLDRTEAIQFAVGRAKPGDTVLLLGKGHEKTIERSDGEHPWDEITTAHQAIKNR